MTDTPNGPARIDRRALLAGATATLGIGSLGLAGCRQPAIGPMISDISGTVLEAGTSRYETWRKAMLWQSMKPDRKPAMIVRPSSNEDIATAIGLARQQNMRVSAKSGGHHIWGSQLRDKGMLIDLWDRRGVEIGSEPGTAWVEPSLWSRDLHHKLAEHGYAFPVGHCATLGMGGFLLGGGLGVNWTNWGGMSCYSVLAAEVITADGSIRIIDDTNEPELFWALRGAGNGFPGIVTRFKLKLYELPTDLRWSMYVFPVSDIESAVEFLQELTDIGLDNTELLTLMGHGPMAPKDATGPDTKVCAVRANIFGRSAEDARRAVDLIAASEGAGRAIFKLEDQPSTFEGAFVDSIDYRAGFGLGRFGVDNVWTNSPREALKALAAEFIKAPSWKSHVVVSMRAEDLKGGVGACRMHGTTYAGVYASWDDAGDDEQNLEWLEACARAIRPFATGHYINEINAGANPALVEASFSKPDWKRLLSVRQGYDPDGVFEPFFGLG